MKELKITIKGLTLLFLFAMVLLIVLPSIASAYWTIKEVDAPKDFRDLSSRAIALDSSGRSHIAYGSDHLYHAYFDGSQWQYEILTSGSTYQIRWQTNSTIRTVQTVKIYGSPNEGQAGTWRVLTTVSGNPGYYDWTIPQVGTAKDKCRLGLRLLDPNSIPIGQDVGDGNFTIQP